MFVPNQACTIRRRTGNSIYGKPTFGDPEAAMCGVVRLEQMSQPTSVRTDSSASGSFAREKVVMSRILFPAKTRVNAGDIVTILDYRMVVQSVWPRINVPGKLDHWQVDLEIYEGD